MRVRGRHLAGGAADDREPLGTGAVVDERLLALVVVSPMPRPRASWIAGFQPPLTARTSAGIVVRWPSAADTVTAVSAGSPSVATTWAFSCTSTPAARSRSVALPGRGAGSMTVTSCAGRRERRRPRRGRRGSRRTPRCVGRRAHRTDRGRRAPPRRASRPAGRCPRTRAAAHAPRSRARPGGRARGGPRHRSRPADSRGHSRRRRSRSRWCRPAWSTPAGGSVTTGCSSTRRTRPLAFAAACRPDRPPPITRVSTCR